MKKPAIVLTLLIVANITFAQTITIESNKKLNTDFSKYKTFTWASQVDHELDEGFYFLNDLVLKADIRDAVEAELEGLGYEKREGTADLVVNFRVFDEPTTLTGYESYGTTYWGDLEVREEEDFETYDVKAGTLLVNLVDKKTGQMVWQGFASGLINNTEFIKDEGKIKEAANLIFEEYGYRAYEYSRK